MTIRSSAIVILSVLGLACATGAAVLSLTEVPGSGPAISAAGFMAFVLIAIPIALILGGRNGR